MKIVVFLFPVTKYIDLATCTYKPCLNPGLALINRKMLEYRLAGYQIWWIHFGRDDNRRAPDFLIKDERIVQGKRDRIIVADTTLTAILRNEGDSRPARHPSVECLLGRLPSPRNVEELVVGGFHLVDCVERFAQAIRAKGFLATIDPDITDDAFSRLKPAITHLDTVRPKASMAR